MQEYPPPGTVLFDASREKDLHTYEQEKYIVRMRQIIWYTWLILEVLLMFRFLLKFFNANPISPFSILVYAITTPLTILFFGVFPTLTLPLGGFVCEWSTLCAMVVYTVLAFIISFFFRLRKPIPPEEAQQKADHELL